MLSLTADLFNQIQRRAEAAYPQECCGVLLGSILEGEKQIQETYATANVHRKPLDRFEIAPRELLAAERHARARGLDVVGFYHSHPDHTAQPSYCDAERAWPVYSYLIVAVENRRAGEALAWELDDADKNFKPERLQVR